MDAETFRAGEGELDWTATVPRQQRGMVLDREIFLAAESAADQLADDANLVVRNAEHLHDAAMIVIHALAGGIHRKRAGAGGHGQRALRFKEGVLLARSGVVPADDVRRLGNRTVNVAALQPGFREQVSVGMQARRALRQGCNRG